MSIISDQIYPVIAGSEGAKQSLVGLPRRLSAARLLAMTTLPILFLCLPITGCYSQIQNEGVNKEAISNEEPQGPYIFDFGRIKEGAVYKHEFVLKNESNLVLKIKDVSASCGCTTPKVTKKTLKPQESTIIEVEFNSKGYSGQVKQYVYVNTDSLDNSLIRYIIKAHVIMTNVKIQSTK